MNTDALHPHVAGALDALRSFLSTLLGTEAALEAGAVETNVTPTAPAGAHVLLGRPGSGMPFAIVLDAGWVDVFAEAAPSGALPTTAAGDRMCEVAGQAYEAVRIQLSAEAITLPDVAFEADAAAMLAEVPQPALRVPFAWVRGAETLQGAVVLAEAVTPQRAAPAPASQGNVNVAPAAFADLGKEQIAGGDGVAGFPDLAMLSDVELEVTVELGRRRLPLSDVLRLTTGSVIELEKLVGQPLEVYANGRLIAEGEAVVIDEQFGVRITNLAIRNKPRATPV